MTVFFFTLNGLDAAWWGVTTTTLGLLSAAILFTILFWERTRVNARWAVPPAPAYYEPYAFRGACNNNGCGATGVKIYESTKAPASDRFSLGFNFGTWAWEGAGTEREFCDPNNHASNFVEVQHYWSLRPNMDGTLQGFVTEQWPWPCPQTVQTPVTAHWAAAVPPGVV